MEELTYKITCEHDLDEYYQSNRVVLCACTQAVIPIYDDFSQIFGPSCAHVMWDNELKNVSVQRAPNIIPGYLFTHLKAPITQQELRDATGSPNSTKIDPVYSVAIDYIRSSHGHSSAEQLTQDSGTAHQASNKVATPSSAQNMNARLNQLSENTRRNTILYREFLGMSNEMTDDRIEQAKTFINDLIANFTSETSLPDEDAVQGIMRSSHYVLHPFGADHPRNMLLHPPDAAELQKLFATGWYADPNMGSFVQIARRESIRRNSFNTMFLSVEDTESIGMRLIEPHIGFVSRTQQIMEKNNTRQIVFPYNVGYVHWVLIVCDIRDKRIAVIDSMNELTSKRHDVLSDHVHQILKTLRLLEDPSLDAEKWPIIFPQCYQQTDGYNCGPITCFHMIRLAQGNPWFRVEQSRIGESINWSEAPGAPPLRRAQSTMKAESLGDQIRQCMMVYYAEELRASAMEKKLFEPLLKPVRGKSSLPSYATLNAFINDQTKSSEFVDHAESSGKFKNVEDDVHVDHSENSFDSDYSSDIRSSDGSEDPLKPRRGEECIVCKCCAIEQSRDSLGLYLRKKDNLSEYWLVGFRRIEAIRWVGLFFINELQYCSAINWTEAFTKQHEYRSRSLNDEITHTMMLLTTHTVVIGKECCAELFLDRIPAYIVVKHSSIADKVFSLVSEYIQASPSRRSIMHSNVLMHLYRYRNVLKRLEGNQNQSSRGCTYGRLLDIASTFSEKMLSHSSVRPLFECLRTLGATALSSEEYSSAIPPVRVSHRKQNSVLCNMMGGILPVYLDLDRDKYAIDSIFGQNQFHKYLDQITREPEVSVSASASGYGGNEPQRAPAPSKRRWNFVDAYDRNEMKKLLFYIPLDYAPESLKAQFTNRRAPQRSVKRASSLNTHRRHNTRLWLLFGEFQHSPKLQENKDLDDKFMTLEYDWILSAECHEELIGEFLAQLNEGKNRLLKAVETKNPREFDLNHVDNVLIMVQLYMRLFDVLDGLAPDRETLLPTIHSLTRYRIVGDLANVNDNALAWYIDFCWIRSIFELAIYGGGTAEENDHARRFALLFLPKTDFV